MNSGSNVCPNCRGKLIKKNIRFVEEINGRIIVVENLPALVCEQCDEKFFTPDVLDYIIELTRGQHDAVRTETVPIYDAAEVA